MAPQVKQRNKIYSCFNLEHNSFEHKCLLRLSRNVSCNVHNHPSPGAQGPGGSGGHPIPSSGAQAYTLPDGDHGERNDSFFSGRTARRRLCAEFPRADPHTGAGIHFFTQKKPTEKHPPSSSSRCPLYLCLKPHLNLYFHGAL